MTEKESVNDLKEKIAALEIELAACRDRIAQLELSDRQYRLLVENIPEIIWIMSADKFKLTYLNPYAEKMLGYTVDEILNKPFQEILTPASFDFAAAYFMQERQKYRDDKNRAPRPHIFEVEYIRKDGTTFWVEVNGSPVFDEHHRFIQIIGVSRDISERVAARKAMKKSEEKYRALFEDSRDTIYITTREGLFVDINPAGLDLFGYSRNEIIGMDIKNIYLDIADREDFQAEIEKAGYVRDYEVRFKRKDEFPIDCLLTSTVWRGDDGTILGYQGVIRDITALKRIIRQLQQIQKMEAIGTLAGGIAHNFNNLLMTIQGNTSLMLMKTDPDHPHYPKLKIIEQHIQYGADLSRQLLGFSRSGQPELKTIKLNLLIQVSAKMFAGTKKEISVHTRFEKDLWPVVADPGQMEQVLLNLLVNAGQAMPDGGDVHIETENLELDPHRISLYRLPPGRYVKITFTDTGIGMDEKTREKIFEPFFTTKEQGYGTGLGLTTVYGIIKHHEGYITVYSEPGKGTTFFIYLPAAEKSAETEKPALPALINGTETILIIDDETMIIDTARTMLAELGYTVYTADSGKKGIELFLDRADRIDLVILDMIMPHMSGSETFERLKTIDPEVKVLLSSGYGLNGQVSALMEKGCRGFIQKPFNIRELSRKIREMLGEG